jgi:polyisoprenoid-binding protein YceI
MRQISLVSLLAGAVNVACASPVTYEVDPSHTYPTFEADHFGGLSVWRGRFDHTTGTIVYDKDNGSGSVRLTIDTTSVDFGHQKLDERVRGDQILDCNRYPTANYSGTLAKFRDGAPTEVRGQFTLRGVTHPLNLRIRSFKCMVNPMSRKEVCGADAMGVFNRAAYGITYDEKYGFKMEVNLLIQVEAIRVN